MSQQRHETVICHYHVRPGQHAAFEALLALHWPTLRAAGLTTDRPPQIFRERPSPKPGAAHGAEDLYIEIFEWLDAEAPNVAHHTPEIMAVWEPMGGLCTKMDFPHFDALDLSGPVDAEGREGRNDASGSR